jgi:transposase-like protein
MNEQESTVISFREEVLRGSRSALDELVREGARRILQEALELEVEDFIARHRQSRDEQGHQCVVRNGYLPAREVVSGVGPLKVRQPRVRRRDPGERFTSSILPPFLRRIPSVDNLIPALYLRGISTNQFAAALEAILGPGAAGLSATNIVRLKAAWQKEYDEWSRRDLSRKRYVYWWVDGLYFQVRLGSERPCLLIVVGTLEDGRKELVAIYDGIRESKLSWQELLRDLKARGLEQGPALAVGDGALGFWAALEEEFPASRRQRCWVHKVRNVLNKLPRSVQPHAKGLLHEIFQSPTRELAERAFDRFVKEYEAKYPKATDCLERDRGLLLSFYDFPAEHWQSLRTTNPIESTFATARHRTRQTKGCGSRLATLSMVFKLSTEAEKSWRRLRGYRLIEHVLRGDRFVDGELRKVA